jgi:hypothetical protein
MLYCLGDVVKRMPRLLKSLWGIAFRDKYDPI